MHRAWPVVLALTSACFPDADKAWDRVGVQRGEVELDGRTVSFRVGGDGPPLVMIHGFGRGGADTWVNQTSFAETHRVVLPDLLAFGSEPGPDGRLGVAEQADLVLDLMDHLDIEQADVVGISYGGFVLSSLASTHPERVRRAVFVDSPGPTMRAADVADMSDRFGVDTPEALLLPETSEGLQRLMDAVLWRDIAIPRPFLVAWHRQAMADPERPLQVAAMRSLLDLADQDLGSTWTIDVPSHVIWGREDELFPLRFAYLLQGALPEGTELVLLEDAGHAPILEAKQAFDVALAAYLDGP